MTIRRTSLCLSMLLLLVLCFALLPAQALAAGDFETPRELEMLSESPAPVFRSSGEITVYFRDVLNWGSPYVYYWQDGPQWPGVAMTYSVNDYGETVYWAKIPAGTTGIIFNDANRSQTVDITKGIVDGAMWYPTEQKDDAGHNYVEYFEPSQQPASEPSTQHPSEQPSEQPTQPSTQQPSELPSEPGTEEPAGESAFYLVGSMTEWQTNDAYLLTKNEAEETAEYVLQAVELSKDDEFHILEVNGSILGFEPVFYPAGFDNNYVVTADGTYNVYFRPNYDGGAGWFEGCIYLVESEQGPQTPDIYVLAGTDNFIPSGWNLGQDSPVMTEGDDGIYSCTVENVVAVENAQYQFKVVQLPGDDSLPIWHGLDGGDQNVAFSLSETCDVTVTYDPDTGEITVSGDGVIEPSTQLSAIYAVGSGKNGFLNNVSWNPAAEANLMTEVADGVYQITYYGIDTDETYPYEFKFAANGGWAVNWGIGSWDVYDVHEADAVLNEDLIYNAGSILFSLENCEDDYVDVTLELDLSQWDADTQTGAKFSIIVGSEQPTEPLTEPLTEQPTELPTVEPQTEAYYLVGTMNGWSADNAYKLTCLDESEVDEYILRNVQLTTDDSFKILYSSDGSSYGMWYPEGMGNSFGENGEIVEDGTYDVYFLPNYDGGEDWFYNCIYVVASEEPVFGEPDFTLPKDIKSIEASAFESADMSVVYIPDGCESIGVNAFRYCTSLRQIRIPASVTTIDQTAFTGCENVVVFGAENSRAQEIAEHYEDYGFVFVAETAMVNLE